MFRIVLSVITQNPLPVFPVCPHPFGMPLLPGLGVPHVALLPANPAIAVKTVLPRPVSGELRLRECPHRFIASHLGKRCLSVSEHPVIGEQLGVLRDVGFRDSVRDCLESLVSDFSPALPSATSAGRGHASREVCSPDITLPSAVATATVHTEAVPRIRTRLAQAYVPKHRPMAKSVAGLQYLVRIYTIIHCSALFNQSQRST